MSISVVVNGAKGRMGSAAVAAIEADPELKLIGALDKTNNLKMELEQLQPQVVVDLTIASVALQNATIILEAGCRPVIGTSGFTEAQVKELQNLAQRLNLGGVIAPNFSPGAVLMMKFSREIAAYFPNVEIIETHHQNKLDAPSGTAMRTAELIASQRGTKAIVPNLPDKSEDVLAGARGARYHDVPVHSVRLPGHVAHQRVIFAGPGEVLTIQHDSNDRSCFMPGICLACRKAPQLEQLYFGLEHLLE